MIFSSFLRAIFLFALLFGVFSPGIIAGTGPEKAVEVELELLRLRQQASKHFTFPDHKLISLPTWLPEDESVCKSHCKDCKVQKTPIFHTGETARLSLGRANVDNYKGLFVGNITALQAQFVDWLLENGLETGGNIAMRAGGSDGVDMSLYATKDLSGGKQQVAAVPHHILFYPDAPKLASRTRKALEIWHALKLTPEWNTVLNYRISTSIALFFERKMPDSFWHLYIRLLQDPVIPAFASEDELKEFQGHYAVNYLRFNERDAYEYGLQLFKVPEFLALLHQPVDFDREMQEFLWAAASVDTRVAYWGGTTEARELAAPFFDNINHHDPCNLHHGLKGRRLPVGDKTSFFPPIHHGMLHSMTLSTYRDVHVKAGEELFICYGSGSSATDMIIDYGFAPYSGSANDFVEMYFPLESTAYKANLTLDLVEKHHLELKERLDEVGLLSLALVKSLAYATTGEPRIFRLLNQQHRDGATTDPADQPLVQDAFVKVYELVAQTVSEAFDVLSSRSTIDQDTIELTTPRVRGSRMLYGIIAFRKYVKMYVRDLAATLRRRVEEAKSASALEMPKPRTFDDLWPTLIVERDENNKLNFPSVPLGEPINSQTDDDWLLEIATDAVDRRHEYERIMKKKQARKQQ